MYISLYLRNFIIPLLIFFSLSFFTPNALASTNIALNDKNAQHSTASVQVKNLQTKVTLQNTGSSNLENIKVDISLIGAELFSQDILHEDYSHQFLEIKHARYDKRNGVFLIDELNAGQSEILLIDYSLKLSPQNDFSKQNDIQDYINPSEKIESNHPEILAQAKLLTQDIQDDMQKAKTFYVFVRDSLHYNLNSPYRNQGALSALNNQEGVCEDFASLFVALCRASGIPARQVNGFADPKESGESWNLLPGQTLSMNKYRHSWAEFYIQESGWLPADPTFDSISGTMNYFKSIPAFTRISQNYYDEPLKITYQGNESAQLKVIWDNELLYSHY